MWIRFSYKPARHAVSVFLDQTPHDKRNICGKHIFFFHINTCLYHVVLFINRFGNTVVSYLLISFLGPSISNFRHHTFYATLVFLHESRFLLLTISVDQKQINSVTGSCSLWNLQVSNGLNVCPRVRLINYRLIITIITRNILTNHGLNESPSLVFTLRSSRSKDNT